MYELTISLPFRVDPFGKVASTSDQKKIWSDRVTTALGTLRDERPMRPEYGTLLSESLFEAEEFAISKAEAEVQRIFSEHLPLLKLTDVQVSIGADQTISIEVIYALPNAEEVTTVIGIATISPDTTLYEESL